MKYVSKKCEIVQFRVGTAHLQLVFTTWSDLLGEERSSVKYVSKKSCSSVALSSLGLALPTHIKVRSKSCSISPRLQIPDSIRLSKKRINFLDLISTSLKLSTVNTKS